MDNVAIRIFLADDTLIAREGWKKILESAGDMKIVGESNSAQETARMVSEISPDILLMDLKWFGDESAGSTAIREVKSCCPNVKIIAVTAYENLIRDARNAGADAALTKTFTKDDLLSLIRELSNRQQSFPPPAVSDRILETLSHREREVLLLVARGRQDKEIAHLLGIATTTAKNHVKSILAKLGARNRLEASNIAREAGLID